MFMHGGINNFNFNSVKTIEDIDNINNTLYDYFLLGKPLPEEITDQELGLLWNRELSDNAGITNRSCYKYFSLIKKIGEPDLVLVVGHTPQNENASAHVSTYDPNVVKKYPYTTRINSACVQRIYRIDTMMSRGFTSNIDDYREVQYGRLNALEINLKQDGTTDTIYNIYHTGKTQNIISVPEY
jgi:hypothetical protein